MRFYKVYWFMRWIGLLWMESYINIYWILNEAKLTKEFRYFRTIIKRFKIKT